MSRDEIVQFIHCARCLRELPEGISPSKWAMLNVGFTRKGMQVWCTRHQCNVAHIDFEGIQHPADLRA